MHPDRPEGRAEGSRRRVRERRPDLRTTGLARGSRRIQRQMGQQSCPSASDPYHQIGRFHSDLKYRNLQRDITNAEVSPPGTCDAGSSPPRRPRCLTLDAWRALRRARRSSAALRRTHLAGDIVSPVPAQSAGTAVTARLPAAVSAPTAAAGRTMEAFTCADRARSRSARLVRGPWVRTTSAGRTVAADRLAEVCGAACTGARDAINVKGTTAAAVATTTTIAWRTRSDGPWLDGPRGSMGRGRRRSRPT